MQTSVLVFVRCDTYYTRDNDFKRPAGRICEPLVIDAMGWTWIATGECDSKSKLLYRRYEP